MEYRRPLPAGAASYNRRMRSLFLAIAFLLPMAETAFGQAAYPARPVRIIVPFGPGGSGDITARTFGHYLETQARQVVVVENRPGGNGILGTEAAKLAAPDGYTLLLTTNTTHAANVSLYKTLPYAPLKDFENIALFGTFGSVVVVPKDSGIDSMAALVAQAKANPVRVFFGYYNSSSQVSAELFRARAGLAMTGVAYKSIGNAVADLLGKQLQVMFMEYVSASSHIEGGKLVALGVTGEKRRAVWPNVPALGELYPGYELFGFLGLAAPARTPAEILDSLNVWVNKAIDSPAVRQTLEKHGMDVKPQSRAEHQAFIAREIERWREQVRTAGIEPQ